MIRRAVATFVLVSAALAACSTFSSTDDPTTPSADAAAPDAAAAEASDAGPPGAIYYEAFEGTSSCRLENVTCTLEYTTGNAYAGSGSCRVCVNADQGGGLHRIPTTRTGTSVRLEAHVRLDSPDASANAEWWAHIAVLRDGGFVGDDGKYGPVNASGWAFAQNVWIPPGPFDEVDVTVGYNAQNGEKSCALIDDVAVFIDN